MIFPNLSGEMAKKGLNQKEIAKMLKKNPSTLSFKLNGKYELTLSEAFRIQKILDSQMSIDELFSKEVI